MFAPRARYTVWVAAGVWPFLGNSGESGASMLIYSSPLNVQVRYFPFMKTCAPALFFPERQMSPVSLFLKDEDVAKDCLSSVKSIASNHKADESGGVSGIRVVGDDQLFVDVETETGTRGNDQEGIDLVISCCDGAGMCPVDQGNPRGRVASRRQHKAVFSLRVDLQSIEALGGRIQAENQAIDFTMYQRCLGADDRVGERLLAGVAPGQFVSGRGLDTIAPGCEGTLVAVIDPASAAARQRIGIENLARSD